MLQTDRQTTDGRAIAYSERERSRSLKISAVSEGRAALLGHL